MARIFLPIGTTPRETTMTTLEAAAHAYASKAQQAYVAKRGGTVPVRAAQSVYDWAYSRFIASPEAAA